jgi:hypothetical protein
MKLQQWGTYSVKDHDRERAFVADVLLYDKLIIPRPATEEELRAEGSDKPIEDQMQRWRRKRWNPKRQRELLDILGEFDLAIEIPWGGRTEDDWQRVYNKQYDEKMGSSQSELAKSIQSQIEMAKSWNTKDAAFIGTGGTLALYVADQLYNKVAQKLFTLSKTPGVPVEPVVAYRSFAKLKADRGLKRAGEGPATGTPTALFGWEFFVPEDSDLSDAQLLRKAAKLASRKDFIEARQSFHGRLKQMYEGGFDSDEAKQKMMTSLAEYSKIMGKSDRKTVARYAAKVAVSVLPTLAGLAGHIPGMLAGAAAAGAGLAIERLIPETYVPEPLQSAAMLYSARRFFGKH